MHGNHLAVMAAMIMAAGLAPPAAATPCTGEVLAAGVQAVQEVLGPNAAVTLADPVCEGRIEEERLHVELQPGGRIGGTVRFALHAMGTRAGRLTATLHVQVPHVRMQHAVAAWTTLDTTVLAEVAGDPGRLPIARLPRLTDVVGRRVKRALTAGEAITLPVVDVPPLVKSGATVTTVARVQGLEVRGRAVAVQDGALGDTVQVVNPDSRKRLRGQVIGESLVEVLRVS